MKHEWNDDGERCLVCGAKDWMSVACIEPETPVDAKLQYECEMGVQVNNKACPDCNGTHACVTPYPEAKTQEPPKASDAIATRKKLRGALEADNSAHMLDQKVVAALKENARLSPIFEKLLDVISALTDGDINSIENYIALMAEGEGDNAKVYQDMAGACWVKLKAALTALRETLEGE